MLLHAMLSLLVFSNATPGAPDLCPSTKVGGLFPGRYGSPVSLFAQLELQHSQGSFRAVVHLSGRLTVESNAAGELKTADLKLDLAVVYTGNKPVNLAAETFLGACSLDKSSPLGFTLACTILPGRGEVRVEHARRREKLTFAIERAGCGSIQGKMSFSYVQALTDSLARMGMRVTKSRQVANFSLGQESGAFFTARSALDASWDRVEALAPEGSLLPEALLSRVGTVAREIEADLKRQADPRVRDCLKAHHRNRVNRFVQLRTRVPIASLLRESLDPVVFVRTGKAVPELVRWLNLLTAAGVETCSERTQQDLVSSIRQRMWQVVEYTLWNGVPAVDVTSVLTRFPATGAVAGPLVRQIPQALRDFGAQRIRDEVMKLRALKASADLCDRQVATAWSRAEAVESLVNRLTGGGFRLVADHRRKVAPRKLNCK